ncbi:unnamed protein product [Adineta ricciae]|uniref:G-protein coupled receptors family 1 profile domain-containing protein n=1 Tax=Adineta ricciae TaxID=249248 RepID=A0A813Z9C1_ADIRI|nr:unnamed protein product [Adineta ricciae]CAF0895051.1 unnamed protein product [Adineta ricciae]
MSSSSTEPDEYHEQIVAFALASVLLSICICGVLGNAVVLGVGIYKQKYRKNVTNCFIMNLAVTDLFFLLTSVPLTSYLGLSKLWIFGEFICKMNIYLAHVFLQATCYTLATMSIDRYLHMVHVLWYRKYRTPKHTLIICLSIWIISLLFMFPYKHVLRMIRRTHTGSRHTLDCSVYDRDSLFSSCIFTFGFYYVLPLSIIAMCYLRVFMRVQSATYHGQKSLVISPCRTNHVKRRRVRRMLLGLTLSFAICWLPIHVLEILNCSQLLSPSLLERHVYILQIIRMIAHALSYFNSCLNPFLYALLNKTYFSSHS